MDQSIRDLYTEYGNFFFMKEIDDSIYQYCYEMERNLKINLSTSTTNLRLAYEAFVETIVKENALQRDLLRTENTKEIDFISLSSKERFLRQRKILPAANISYAMNNGAIVKKYALSFIRKLGNGGAHPGEKPDNPAVTYKNFIKAAEILHSLLAEYYKDQIAKKYHPVLFRNKYKSNVEKTNYYQDLIPIRDFKIVEGYRPKDHQRTNCFMEYLAISDTMSHVIDDGDNKQFHHIIRQYYTKDINDNLYKRIFHVNNSANDEESLIYKTIGASNIRSIPKGKKNDEFNFIIYTFDDKVKIFEEKILKSLNIKEKIEFLVRLAQILREYHNFSNPIYHRNLSYESIFVSEKKNRFIPYIVKLDFAKIDKVPGEFYTVQEQVVSARNKLVNKSVEKYIAPEWEKSSSLKGNIKLDWEKLDIFSFGVLMLDILTDDFNKIHISDEHFEQLENQGYGENLIFLIEECIQEMVSERPSMNEIYDLLVEEKKRWT